MYIRSLWLTQFQIVQTQLQWLLNHSKTVALAWVAGQLMLNIVNASAHWCGVQEHWSIINWWQWGKSEYGSISFHATRGDESGLRKTLGCLRWTDTDLHLTPMPNFSPIDPVVIELRALQFPKYEDGVCTCARAVAPHFWLLDWVGLIGIQFELQPIWAWPAQPFLSYSVADAARSAAAGCGYW